MPPTKKATAAAKDTEPAATDDDGRTVAELQDELRTRGLATSGTRQELLDRLADDDEDIATELRETTDRPMPPAEAPTAADDADTRTVADLQDELRRRGEPTSGIKDELLDRLASADRADGDAETDPQERRAQARRRRAEQLIAEDGSVDADHLATVVGDTRALIDEIRARLDDEVDGLLADHEEHLSRRAVTPAAGPGPDVVRLGANARRVRSQLEDVRDALARLTATVAALLNDTLTG